MTKVRIPAGQERGTGERGGRTGLTGKNDGTDGRRGRLMLTWRKWSAHECKRLIKDAPIIHAVQVWFT